MAEEIAQTVPPASDIPSEAAALENSGTNIKETIESILVAFILAFVFRAFVLEAFVIPTGSMAPTLLGAHMRYHCPDCGYQFDVNYSSPSVRSDADDVNIPDKGTPNTDVYCPNCGYLVATPPARNDPNPQELAVHYGDRILVLKFIYLLHPPERWDVVVFKSPASPNSTHYSQNYIKRLVGRPGESLMVLDGDIYVSTDKGKTWTVQTKPRSVQEALWRIVYDNDYYPQHPSRQGMPDWHQPWVASEGSGWKLNDPSNPRTFHFENGTGSGAVHFDPNANSTTHTLTDYLVYDLGPGLLRRPSPTGSTDDENANAVSDLKLVGYYQRTAGDGVLRLKLSRFEKLDHTFTAEISTDSVRLLHRTNNGQSQVGPIVKLADLGLSANSPMFIEFMNVDYHVSLRINGRDILETTPQDYRPDVAWLTDQFNAMKHGQPGQAAIEAEKQTCTLSHVSLWRDVYYTNRDMQRSPLHWASPRNPVDLGDDEYFVMGDNSAISGDARYWTDPIDLPGEGLNVKDGRVPGQFMLGKAIFVYWPAGYRPFDPNGYAIIPNFGDMRWIH